MTGKRHKANLEVFDSAKRYTLSDVFGLLEKFKGPKFDETINVAFRLGLDPKQADQQVRGATVLPNGLGTKTRIVVFAKGAKAQEAKDAGADFVGDDDIVQKIVGGWMDFDKVIATPDMMVTVSKVGKILGPRGLMPNPKTGTVTLDVKKAISDEQKGKVEFRIDKAGIIHAPIGKKSFGPKKLSENFVALADTINRLKPATSKGIYMRSITVSGAMSPGIKVDTSQVGSSAE